MIRRPTRSTSTFASLVLAASLLPGSASAAGNVLLEASASFHGEQEGEYAGEVSGLGDVNGDGLDDFFIGAWQAWGGAGAAYLFLGRSQAWPMDTPTSDADTVFHGEGANESVGYGRPVSPGDLNGDGFNDVFIDDMFNDDAGVNAGAAYIFFGSEEGWDGEVSVDEADSSFLGEGEDDLAGFSRVLGDMDGDLLDDLTLDSCRCAGRRGCVYTVLGAPSGWAPNQSLTEVDGTYVGEYPYDYACVLGGGGMSTGTVSMTSSSGRPVRTRTAAARARHTSFRDARAVGRPRAPSPIRSSSVLPFSGKVWTTTLGIPWPLSRMWMAMDSTIS
jgi:hypothetical protein